jgi:hypothetical protein
VKLANVVTGGTVRERVPIQARLLFKIRALVVFFIAGLVLSGVTAFPLLKELEMLASLLGIARDGVPADYSGFQHWIALIREGLRETYAKYPFIGYGTDWLAFGHIVIALFFLPVYRDPMRYSGNLRVGVIACFLVIPLALICGPIRGIPFYWQLVDCSFGVLGILPLLFALHLIRRLSAARSLESRTH